MVFVCVEGEKSEGDVFGIGRGEDLGVGLGFLEVAGADWGGVSLGLLWGMGMILFRPV